jgi:hypothetical protein
MRSVLFHHIVHKEHKALLTLKYTFPHCTLTKPTEPKYKCLECYQFTRNLIALPTDVLRIS